MKPQPHSYLSAIENYVPGKALVNGKKAIKLSSNENALGASPRAVEAYKKHAADLSLYADGSCGILREKLAQKNQIEANRIICGAGSDEIIALLTAAFAGIGDEIIYSEHGFLMYPISAKRVGAMAIKIKERNLKADVTAILAAISERTKIIFIANPNNPTGSYLTTAEIDQLIAKTPKNVLIVLDHAYEEFVEVADYPNAIELVKKHANVVVTRTFSKIFGLASLRLGWCYASAEIAEILNKIRGPFNVGGPAQFAGVAALEDEEFLAQSKLHNTRWLEIMLNALGEGNSLRSNVVAHSSVANFILLDFGNVEQCQKYNTKFLQEVIVLRDMVSYGLPHCLRVTIGLENVNNQLLEILK